MLLSDNPQPFHLYLRKLSLEKLMGFVQDHKESESKKSQDSAWGMLHYIPGPNLALRVVHLF